MPIHPTHTIDGAIGDAENRLEPPSVTGKFAAQGSAGKLQSLFLERQFGGSGVHRRVEISSVASVTPSLCNSARLVANSFDPVRAKRAAMAHA